MTALLSAEPPAAITPLDALEELYECWVDYTAERSPIAKAEALDWLGQRIEYHYQTVKEARRRADGKPARPAGQLVLAMGVA